MFACLLDSLIFHELTNYHIIIIIIIIIIFIFITIIIIHHIKTDSQTEVVQLWQITL